ncbi:MAG: IclR family transcriptional regulator [Pseudomonadota bacterium]|nr:IclR family transcriptional regulator [Pseudomonadota bacterium]
MRQADTSIDQPSGPPDRQFVTALARGLRILGCFHPARSSLTVTEIAAELGLPQPTAWRLCQTMLSLGYLTANDAGRLRPALAVLRLGYATLSELPLAELARPYLQELADAFGGAAGMAVCDGHDMRFVQRCESASQLVLNLRIGSRVPVATSAVGWAYLAGLPEADWDAASGSPAAWAAAKPEFRSAFARYATDGFIINPGVLHPGYNTAAVPVMGPDGTPALTLNCGGAGSVLSVAKLRTEVGPRLRALAALIAASL